MSNIPIPAVGTKVQTHFGEAVVGDADEHFVSMDLEDGTACWCGTLEQWHREFVANVPPDFHDYPTCPGWWVICANDDEAEGPLSGVIAMYFDSDQIDRGAPLSGDSVYGPLPLDESGQPMEGV